MKAKDLPYEVGDAVTRVTDWGETENGRVTWIPDGEFVHEIEVEDEYETVGIYAPEQWEKLT